MNADGRDPIERAAALMCGSILEHGFREYFVERLYLGRREDDVRAFLCRRLRVFHKEKMFSLHRITPSFAGR